MKNQKGITLIALVVTIIVLLILAGVAIAMLTGDNSILTNAQKSSSNNAYYSVREQVGLAYSAVATEIRVQTVANGKFNAITNIARLAKLVRNDLGNESKWKVEYKGSIIYLTYTDSAIDKGAIDDTSEGNEIPAEEGVIHSTITLENQNASYDFDNKTAGSSATTVNYGATPDAVVIN
jgi:type II secretory pathway pseudopilin PulG